MTYDRKNLVHTAGGLSPLPQNFEYHSAESITPAGYFPKNEGIRAGDKVTKVNVTVVDGLVTARVDKPCYIKADIDGELTAVEFV